MLKSIYSQIQEVQQTLSTRNMKKTIIKLVQTNNKEKKFKAVWWKTDTVFSKEQSDIRLLTGNNASKETVEYKRKKKTKKPVNLQFYTQGGKILKMKVK